MTIISFALLIGGVDFNISELFYENCFLLQINRFKCIKRLFLPGMTIVTDLDSVFEIEKKNKFMDFKIEKNLNVVIR